MEMHQIRYFLAACEARNFTRASELCAVSQPALTKAIKNLEEELGGALFLRDSRPLQLTNLGRLLQDRFGRLWALSNEIKVSARAFLDLQRSNFRLGVLSTLGQARVAAIWASVQQLEPKISLSVQYACQRKVLNELITGVIELAVVADYGFPEAGLEIAELLREPYGAAMRPEHPLAAQADVGVAELPPHDFIQRSHCERAMYFQELFSRRGLALMVSFESDQEDLVHQLVAEGRGVCVLPRGLAHPSLAFRPLREPSMERMIVLAHKSERPLSPVAQAVKAAILRARLS